MHIDVFSDAGHKDSFFVSGAVLQIQDDYHLVTFPRVASSNLRTATIELRGIFNAVGMAIKMFPEITTMTITCDNQSVIDCLAGRSTFKDDFKDKCVRRLLSILKRHNIEVLFVHKTQTECSEIRMCDWICKMAKSNNSSFLSNPCVPKGCKKFCSANHIVGHRHNFLKMSVDCENVL